MEQGQVIARTAEFVHGRLAGEGTGHDWWHVERVWRMAVRLAADEPVDHLVVELAALLHDVADWKFHGGDDEIGPRLAGEWLAGVGVEPLVIAHVQEIVRDLSFKGAGVPRPMRTREGAVVQDADRLDAIGAIGIARAFAYGAHKGNTLHEPGVAPSPHATAEAYKAGSGSTVNHFYEKLLLLRDRMNTERARRLADGRHSFLEEFLERFHGEWDGRC